MTTAKILDVRPEHGHWYIFGLRQPIELHYNIPFPETEWPEVGSIKGKKEMLRALYDECQTNEDLAKFKSGIVFYTPYGVFATISYHVGPIEDVVEAANRLSSEHTETFLRIKEHFMSMDGYGRSQVDAIVRQYGGTYADWPKDLSKGYWAADDNAHNLAQKMMRIK